MPRNHAEVRTLLEQRLPGGVSDLIWDFLLRQEEESGAIQAVVNGAPGAATSLVGYAKDLQEYFGDARAARGYTSAPMPATPSKARRTKRAMGYERSRLKVLTNYLVKRVASDSDLRRFRETFLGGRALPLKRARRWLASPAPRFLSLDDFNTRGIPLVAHRARLVGHRRVSSVEGDFLCIERHVTLDISWRGGHHKEEIGYRWARRPGVKPEPPLTMPLPAVRGYLQKLAVFPHSVFAVLRELSLSLSSKCRWNQYEAVLFAVSGRVPTGTGIQYEARPEWTSLTADDVVVLTVDSWVSPETVADTYRWIQQDILGGRSRAHETSLEIVDLAVEKMRPGGPFPAPEKLMREWNRRHPARAYQQLWRFKSHYATAVEQILFSGRLSHEKRLRRARKP